MAEARGQDTGMDMIPGYERPTRSAVVDTAEQNVTGIRTPTPWSPIASSQQEPTHRERSDCRRYIASKRRKSMKATLSFTRLSFDKR